MMAIWQIRMRNCALLGCEHLAPFRGPLGSHPPRFHTQTRAGIERDVILQVLPPLSLCPWWFPAPQNDAVWFPVSSFAFPPGGLPRTWFFSPQPLPDAADKKNSNTPFHIHSGEAQLKALQNPTNMEGGFKLLTCSKHCFFPFSSLLVQPQQLYPKNSGILSTKLILLGSLLRKGEQLRQCQDCRWGGGGQRESGGEGAPRGGWATAECQKFSEGPK